MTQIDLAPAGLRMAALVAAVPEELLGAPTPCPAYCVGDLLDHIAGLGTAFSAAARKDAGADSEPAPPGDRSRLSDDWRSDIAAGLSQLTDAWRSPAAWSGVTRVGGVVLPGEVCGLVGLNELVVHAWDLGRATGQPVNAEPEVIRALLPMLDQFSPPIDAPRGDGPFGPRFPVSSGAPLLDQLVGLAGRDPSWSPATALG